MASSDAPALGPTAGDLAGPLQGSFNGILRTHRHARADRAERLARLNMV